MIEFKRVSVVYDGQIEALKDINIKLDDGHCIGIIGQNGSGKSTLLSTLVGIIETIGEILIDGLTVDKNHLIEIRKEVGLVFQNPDHQLFMSTIKEDLSFGLINQGKNKQEINQAVEEISQRLGIQELIERRSAKLSGGQKRMAALASVLIMKPKLLLLDEPSSFLDPKSRRQLIEVIKELNQTILIATHDLDMAVDLCDTIILLNEGQIVKHGKAKDILLNQELLENNGLELPFKYQR